jgi:hypothetical protein
MDLLAARKVRSVKRVKTRDCIVMMVCKGVERPEDGLVRVGKLRRSKAPES